MTDGVRLTREQIAACAVHAVHKFQRLGLTLQALHIQHTKLAASGSVLTQRPLSVVAKAVLCCQSCSADVTVCAAVMQAQPGYSGEACCGAWLASIGNPGWADGSTVGAQGTAEGS